MFNQYYSRAATQDKLSNLTDSEITMFVRDSPSKMKKRLNKIVKELDKNGVRLDDRGEVVWGQMSKLVVDKLKSNPMVKIALMERDLSYEFPHHEHRMQYA
jgi:hypothetical protein